MRDRNTALHGRFWKLACGAMAAVLLLTLIGWGVALGQEGRAPLCWLRCETPPAARLVEPPAGEADYGIHTQSGFYELDFTLRNEGERALVLYDYALQYEPGQRDASAWDASGGTPLLAPVPVLPAGQTARFTRTIEVWGISSPEDAFPLTVRYQTYEDDLLIGQVELAGE